MKLPLSQKIQLIYLLLSVSSSTAIVFLFKFFPRYQIDTFQAIVFNYLFCVLSAWVSLGAFPIEANVMEQFWFPYALALGTLFISTFNVVAFTVQKFGVTVGAVMQKMSILLSVTWAIFMHAEGVSGMKILGILAAIAAIILTNLPEKSEESTEIDPMPKWQYIFPATVLIGSGIIEILLFEVETKAETSGDINFIATLFGVAGVIGLMTLVFQLVTGRSKLVIRNIIAGAILGVINFFSIVYLMKTLGYGWDASVVLPINNVGIIGLSALIAYFLFKEHLSKLNWVGVLMAGLSILLISFS